MTAAQLDETRQQREERLQLSTEREERPFVWNVKCGYDVYRKGVLYATPFAIGIVLVLLAGGADLSWVWSSLIAWQFYAVAAALFITAYPKVAFGYPWRWIKAGARTLWRINAAQRAVIAKERLNAARADEKAAADELPADSFGGMPIADLASKIAARSDGTFPREWLMRIGLKEWDAKKLHGLLTTSKFLAYPVSGDPNVRALGAELIAGKDPRNDRVTTLNTHLMSASEADRARVVANAIRKGIDLTPEPEPRILADKLTPTAEPMSALGHATQTGNT